MDHYKKRKEPEGTCQWNTKLIHAKKESIHIVEMSLCALKKLGKKQVYNQNRDTQKRKMEENLDSFQ